MITRGEASTRGTHTRKGGSDGVRGTVTTTRRLPPHAGAARAAQVAFDFQNGRMELSCKYPNLKV